MVQEAPPQVAPTARSYPIYVPPSDSAAWSADLPLPDALPSEVEPVAGATPIPLASATPASGTGAIRFRDEASNPFASAPARSESRSEPEEMSAAGAYEPFRTTSEPQAVPWKLIAAGVVLIGATVAITKGFAPSSAMPIIETVRKAAPKTPPAEPAPPAPIAGNAGRLTVTTEPAGAKVTLDGKAAGETPLTLDTVKPGRHTIVVTAASGATAKRTVRVESGQTLAVDVPLFSGFAAISAPFILDVSENGKALGTSEDQILLSPGSHRLRVGNKDLGYVGAETVEIQAGEVTRLSLDPRGRANINAAPWAEVWIDGERAGDTPLANVAIRLGVREIVFKNPQFGERKVTTTIKANAPATISIDFSK
ncbi:MAG TPA: PEGA domain-containing protein [Vicinamibacterales bacterium]|nr:PEGA domain-containing protein [Vicinamibacterales bacterium]